MGAVKTICEQCEHFEVCKYRSMLDTISGMISDVNSTGDIAVSELDFSCKHYDEIGK